MPIYKFSGKLLYFAHVPKCGGSSIEHYLKARFGPAAFLNGRYKPGKKRFWSRNSPQHIPAESLSELFPDGFFDAGFAVVREPVYRVLSAFYFQRDRMGWIPKEEAFEDWLGQLRRLSGDQHRLHDNHFLPQSRFVPAWCKVFHLERGMNGVVSWLDQLDDRRFSGTIGRKLGGRYANLEISGETRSLISEIYAEDYERFGYEREE